jgi:hypothetical protein
VIVYLWDAPGPVRIARGIRGDETAARRAAEACLLAGHARAARVEAAVAVLEAATPEFSYRRTSTGWQARSPRNGTVSWVSFPGPAG